MVACCNASRLLGLIQEQKSRTMADSSEAVIGRQRSRDSHEDDG